MEQRKVILNENKGIRETNQDTNLNVSLDSNVRLLPYGNINEKLSLYKQYTDERDSCETYRMIFTVNPLCTNVLYNMITEIVKKEGSDSCICLNINPQQRPANAGSNNVLNEIQAVRDSEYTHKELFDDKEPYVYHCGVNIFNNHLLRSEEFTYVSYSKIPTSGFNSIYDVIRDKDGNVVKEKIGVNELRETDMHLYRYDNFLSMYDAYRNKLNEENGWYGFTNPGNIEIPNLKIGDDWISVNRLMNNNKACEFYDLYPDRSLFSFVPKVNKYRNRVEYNWDYDIMYPAESDIRTLNLINGLSEGLRETNGGGSIRIIKAEKSYTNSGTQLIRFKSMMRHTLKSGDYVRLYYYTYRKGDTPTNVTPSRFSARIKVASCGDENGLDTNRYFSVKYQDLSLYFGFDILGVLCPRMSLEEGTENLDIDTDKTVNFYFKKEVNGYECKYYLRKFKKVSDKKLASEINKLAYGENIYGDRVAQIVFTDDINVSGLVDNLGMPLKEVYLVFFKTNRGYKEWYYSGNTSGDTVEYSHCFGKVTSGLDLPSDSGCVDYNVRRLHNVDLTARGVSEQTKILFASCMTIPKVIDDDLTVDSKTMFGDVVEFDRTTCIETPIENVYHRFNTEQRELTQQTNRNDCFCDIWDEEIVYDDYDTGVNPGATNGFKVSLSRINLVDGDANKAYRGNIAPEGYFYNPKTKIKLKDISADISSSIGKIIKYTAPESIRFDTVYLGISGVTLNEGESIIDETGGTTEYWRVNISATTKYDWIKNDSVYFYDTIDEITIVGTVVDFNTENNTFSVIVEKGLERSKLLNPSKLIAGSYTIVTSRDTIPPYAVYLPNSRKFVWRSLLKMSELNSENELYDMPFSNGCLYIHQNVNFFLKRQDPRNEYGLAQPESTDTQMKFYRKMGWEEYDRSYEQYIDDNFNNICY